MTQLTVRPRLVDEVAVVTGGASGIGAAIVRRLVAEGAQVVVGDKDEHRLDAFRAELGESAVSCRRCDVCEESDVAELVDVAVRAHDRLTLGFNVAGLARPAPLEELTVDQWDTTVNVCLKGVFLSTKHEGRQMLSQGHGAIVNVASIMARMPSRGSAAYSAAKAGIVTLTRSAAMEWGDRGVRVNSISPGITHTPPVAPVIDDPERIAPFLARIPFGRVASPDEIAAAAIFLGSADASYMSGADLLVDGALSTTGYPYARTPGS